MGLCLDRSPLHRIGGLSHRGDTLAQAILTVAPFLGTGACRGPGPAKALKKIHHGPFVRDCLSAMTLVRKPAEPQRSRIVVAKALNSTSTKEVGDGGVVAKPGR